MAMLQVHSLAFDYQDTPLLNAVNFSLLSGKLLHLCGGNGAGKTTLLKLLAGFLTPASGAIYWNNRLINDDLRSYQRALCYVGHKMGLSPQLTVKENCYFTPHWPKESFDFKELLQRFGLQNLENKRCANLSEGQKRRAALLRLTMTRASLWLLDEPFIALDEIARELIADCMSRHLQKGGSIIMTSHQSLQSLAGHHQEYYLS